MRHQITIHENDAGQRLDKFLSKYMPDMPKSMIYKLIRKKDIRLNQKRCQGNEILQLDDQITIFAEEKFFSPKKKKLDLQISGNLQICYEDPDFLIVCKSVGQDVHNGDRSGFQNQTGSLIEQIRAYLYEKQEYLPEQEQSFSPALCNRIDRNTEGLVIAAKNAAALRSMNEAIRLHQVHKSYLAVTNGKLPRKQDICTAWLKKDAQRNQVRILADPPDSTWQEIRTQYEVLAERGNYQLVKINLLTGRTHQIRAHLAYLHAPLLGERKYRNANAKQDTRNSGASRKTYQCLCAWQITFSGLTSPILQYLEQKTITAPVPEFVRNYFPDFKNF
ncbi:MAG: RluA family pseudouridine synthase [Oscillospiraceae bacterium]|nr:RluA family pseudouridine synthase [Oscillospiraceae bacterium]